MSETKHEPTLAETLRAWVEADAAYRRAGDVATAALVEVPTLYRHHDTAMAYLRGYDDARAECAAEIEENGVLKRRVQELEAAVGVVGEVKWGVEVEGVVHCYVSHEAAKRDRAAWTGSPRVVAIVDPDAVVPLASKEPVAWRDDQRGEGFFMRSVAAQSNTTTVTPLYAGAPEPARGEA